MRIITALLLILGICGKGDLWAQEKPHTYQLNGLIKDSINKTPVQKAIIRLTSIADSTIKFTQLANNSGVFSFSLPANGSFNLTISHQNYEDWHYQLDVLDPSQPVNLSIMLVPKTNELEEVQVKSTFPIVIRGDTLEYKASMFRLNPIATTQNLLMKLPGVYLSPDGELMIQGEMINRILIDGKRYFGDDPVTALKNIPPEIIDRIQVLDGKSDQSSISGISDAIRIKTLNIILKQDIKNGTAGRVLLGKAISDQYETGFNLNRFNPNYQLTVFAEHNNLNKSNFSTSDAGSDKRILSTAPGRPPTKLMSAGGNFISIMRGIADLSSNYVFSDQVSTLDQKGRYTYFYSGDSTNVKEQNQRTNTSLKQHRININLEKNIDSANTIGLIANTNLSNTQTLVNTNYRLSGGSSALLASGDLMTAQLMKSHSVYLDFFYRHKFKRQGQLLSVRVNQGTSGYILNGSNFVSSSSYSNGGIFLKGDTLDQKLIRNVGQNSWRFNAAYSQPINSHQRMELSINYQPGRVHSNRYAYNKDPLSHQHEVLDTSFSRKYDNENNTTSLLFNYHLSYSKFTVSAYLNMQRAELNITDNFFRSTIKRSFTSLLPNLTGSYSGKLHKFLFSYEVRQFLPSHDQLQPVIDYVDPLNMVQGDPNLKPSKSHNFGANLNYVNPKTRHMYTLSLQGSFVQRQISKYSINILPGLPMIEGIPDSLPAGAILSRPINLNGSHNLFLTFNYSMPLRTPKSNLNFTLNVMQSRMVNMFFDVPSAKGIINKSDQITTSPVIRWTSNLKNLDFNVSTTSIFSYTKYSLQGQKGNNFFSQALQTDLCWYNNGGWLVFGDLSYQFLAQGINRSITLLNFGMAKQILKDKSAEIRLTAFDLLNKNKRISWAATDNLISQVSSNALTRYFEITLSWKLRRFSKFKI